MAQPDVYVDPKNEQRPEVAEHCIVLPAQLADELGADAARKAVAEQVAEQEGKAHAEAKQQHRTFLGEKRVTSARITVCGTADSCVPTFAAAADRDAAKRSVIELRTLERATVKRPSAESKATATCGSRAEPASATGRAARAQPRSDASPRLALGGCQRTGVPT